MIDGKYTCAECKAMVEFCCDYGICDHEYCRARDAEFGSSDSQTNSSFYDAAEWALLWMPDHMRDMQRVACEYFE